MRLKNKLNKFILLLKYIKLYSLFYYYTLINILLLIILL